MGKKVKKVTKSVTKAAKKAVKSVAKTAGKAATAPVRELHRGVSRTARSVVDMVGLGPPDLSGIESGQAQQAAALEQQNQQAMQEVRDAQANLGTHNVADVRSGLSRKKKPGSASISTQLGL